MHTPIRFILAFQSFVRVFADADHPLVIFLDDLQWADQSSLKLIELFISDPQMQHMMVVGAYRDSEVGEAHPLMMMLDEKRKVGTNIHTITLMPLELHHVNHLIADAINRKPDEAKALSELCLSKTGGNPFFLRQFLQTLYEEQLIWFEQSQGIWRWDLKKIRESEMTDNVVELMTGKILRLSPESQNVLKLASCIGNQFELAILSIVNAKPARKTAGDLSQALLEGLIIHADNSYRNIKNMENVNVTYRFLHDRIQQAAYSLIKEEDRRVVNLRIGRLMLSSMMANEQEERIFDIADHLNAGRELIESQSERAKVAELNLQAGKKAKASAAFELAHRYLQMGLALLGEDSWEKRYDLALELHIEAAEAAYLSSDFEEMERVSGKVIMRAATVLNKARAYEVMIFGYIFRNMPMKAIEAALEILKLLGIRLPAKPNTIHIVLALLRTKLALAGKQIEDLVNLPEMTDPNKLQVLHILTSVGSAAFFVSQKLMVLMILKSIVLFTRGGVTYLSAYPFVAYGMILCNFLGNIDAGYQFGRLALRLLERFNAKDQRPRTVILFFTFIHCWNKRWKDGLKSIIDVFHVALEAGDLEWAAHSLQVYSYISYFTGGELGEYEQETRKYIEIIAQLNKGTAYFVAKMWRQTVLNLLGKNEDPCLLIGESYDEKKLLQSHIDANDHSTLSLFYLSKLILCYLFEEFERALENVIRGKVHYENQFAGHRVYFCFYASLVYIGICVNAQEHEKKSLLREVAKNQKKMKKWASHAPMNYLHKYYLVEAERARVLGNGIVAMDFYDKAIELSMDNEYLNEEALANEVAARFYLSRGREKIAGTYMAEARFCYLKWGAKAKVEQIDEKYSYLLHKEERTVATEEKPTDGTSSIRAGVSGSLDLASMVKASQTISREMVLEKLLGNLMKIVIENAGAERGYLILEREGKWYIEAEGWKGKVDLQVLQSIPLDRIEEGGAKQLVPDAIVHYVLRTGRPVVLDDAGHDGQYGKEIYISSRQVKSVLCMPLVNQGKLVGILYLENNLMTGAFTRERIEVLDLLASQIAISIENALNFLKIEDLNKNLERNVEERTRELNLKNEQIMASIHYARTIQLSILPREERINELCPNHFVIWRPRDVVGGDFYYFEKFYDNYLLGVIDCTGHGVPGAFMAMTVKSVLDRITQDICHEDPAKILIKLNTIIRTTLNQDVASSLSNDGLDIGLCSIEPEKRKLIFAGARIPLYYCKDGKIYELTAGKQSIGYKESGERFESTNTEIEIAFNDEVFYLSTDGFLHQSGGEKSFSFGRKRFQGVLLESWRRPMQEQKGILEAELKKYQGRVSQRDDITVFGFCIGAPR